MQRYYKIALRSSNQHTKPAYLGGAEVLDTSPQAAKIFLSISEAETYIEHDMVMLERLGRRFFSMVDGEELYVYVIEVREMAIRVVDLV